MDVHGLDLPRLRALAASVELGSQEAAAEALGLTPSALSQRLQALEAATGRPVLVRSRPVLPTATGLVLIDLLKQIEGLEPAAPQRDASPSPYPAHRPRLSIAVPPELVTWALTALVGLSVQWQVSVLEADATAAADLLRAGEVLGALVLSPQPIGGCTRIDLGALTYRAVASPAFAERYGLTSTDDADITSAVRSAPAVKAQGAGADLLDQVTRLDQSSELEHDLRARADIPAHVLPAGASQISAVTLGLGWAVLTEPQVSELLKSGDLVDVAAGRVLQRTLSWQHWNLATPAVNELTDAVVAASARLLAGVTPAGTDQPVTTSEVDATSEPANHIRPAASNERHGGESW
ncbi:ArgP/LysG family DNA-binding transcriptional regulator [Streptomyces sp. NP160]|uniref:ArgP/LysG family DNA-binding transcriptional regulator n=1 Tax=Streptomyces sp. NP160 TaxID=2586637 RepID=UPI0011184346|nr:ArgP/LysG family DNA-binding transcriptional regulator [Streptomyces sp. NP160]TNM61939.1 ArgP/LysG family DNA-binding transcriptional regulator [Streptomyces sp. NP160]